MFKLEQYKILAVSCIATATLMTTCQGKDLESSAYGGLWNAKEDISGGVYYPIKDGKTGPYKVNTQVYKDSDELITTRNMYDGKFISVKDLEVLYQKLKQINNFKL